MNPDKQRIESWALFLSNLNMTLAVTSVVQQVSNMLLNVELSSNSLGFIDLSVSDKTHPHCGITVYSTVPEFDPPDGAKAREFFKKGNLTQAYKTVLEIALTVVKEHPSDMVLKEVNTEELQEFINNWDARKLEQDLDNMN